MTPAPRAVLALGAISLSALILPIGLSIFMYIGWFRSKDVLGGYRYPKWLLVVGTLGAAAAVSFVLFFDDFAPLRASALIPSSTGTTVGMSINALVLATVLLGPVWALVAAWQRKRSPHPAGPCWWSSPAIGRRAPN